MENHFEDFASVTLSAPQLDRLRRSIIDIAAIESALDYDSLAHHLAKRKLSQQVKAVEESVSLSMDWFVDPSAAQEDALTGWRHILARHKRDELKRDLDEAQRQLGTEVTSENLERLKLAKTALLEAEGNEADLDGFGLASGRKNNI
jgi:DNA primase